MNAACDVIQLWLRAALWCAFFVIASPPSHTFAQSSHADAGIGDIRMSFLSEDSDKRPAEEAPGSAPPESYDGAWTFTSGGCRYTGSLPARIVGGRLIFRGGRGQVEPDGTVHSVGAGNGMTFTAVGQLSGNTGSGTFNRSDGCVGRWIGIRRGPLPGRRP
jgi:hypothetical protein